MKLSEVKDTKKYKIVKVNNKGIERELYNCGLFLNDIICFQRDSLFKSPIQIICNDCIFLSIGRKEAEEIEIQECIN